MSEMVLVTVLAANVPNVIVGAACIVCLVLLLRSTTIAVDAVRMGAAGFACLLLETLIGIGAQSAIIVIRDASESYRNIGLAMAASGYVRLVLKVGSFVLLTRAIFVGARR